MAINILRIKGVTKKVGVSRATIYNLVRAGQFPRSIQITANTSGWLEHEVDEWLETRIRESRKAAEEIAP